MLTPTERTRDRLVILDLRHKNIANPVLVKWHGMVWHGMDPSFLRCTKPRVQAKFHIASGEASVGRWRAPHQVAGNPGWI